MTHADLETKYPEFFRDCYCGNDALEEWLPLLDILCGLIEWDLKQAGIPLNAVQVVQTKIKFTMLRFYVKLDKKLIDDVLEAKIRAYIDMAQFTSEIL